METATDNNQYVDILYHSNQKKIFFSTNTKKKVIAKGRRFGLTRGYANRAIEYLLDGISPGLWVDTVYTNIDRYVERYFFPVLQQIPKGYWKWRQQKKELDIHGHKLDFRSADRPELIEGFAYRFMFLNEAGIILRNEYLYYNTILPMTLDFNPDFYVGGTPKGKGLFHELSVRAEDPGNKDQEFYRFSSYDNPYLDREELDNLVNEIPQSIQKQEIYAEFLEDSSTVFRNLDKCSVIDKPTEPHKERLISYYMGIDLARVQDYTVITVLDQNGNEVFQDRFNQIDWRLQKERIAYICKKYNNADCWIDSTGVGDPIFEDLRNEGLNINGFHFTNERKKQLIQSLMISLEQEKIKIFSKEANPVQYNELLIFEYEMTSSGLIRYKAPEGYHDDCVFSLALANWGLQDSFCGTVFGTLDRDIRPD